MDGFKVDHALYVYQQQKSKGTRKYSIYYGSVVGGVATMILFVFLFVYLYFLFGDMMNGKNDVLDEKFVSNAFQGKDGYYNFSASNS